MLNQPAEAIVAISDEASGLLATNLWDGDDQGPDADEIASGMVFRSRKDPLLQPFWATAAELHEMA